MTQPNPQVNPTLDHVRV